ncbi:MAG: intracellular sulfur oxidation DsrE/DsrF family protein [Candidatus Nanohaloarchaea archaeon]|jgi:intracellular sulfur oxidation DsrE/DsrF family protein
MKVVFHLNSPDASKKSELLGNMENLKQDERVEIEDMKAILNSEAITLAFKNSDASKYVEECRDKGVDFRICGNSLENAGKDKQDLVEGVEVVDSGVGELTILEEKGYNYIKV